MRTMNQERKPGGSVRLPRYVGEMVDWLDAMVVTIFCIVLIFTFAFRMVGVEGTSMLETLQNKDKVILSNLFYTPERGDIVVISRTNQHQADGESLEPLIKRVIALEGDEVDLREGVVYVNNEPIDEPYLDEKYNVTEPRGYYGISFPVKVPEGRVFVLGDNRPISKDSRSADVGMVDSHYILGKAVMRVWPLSSFEVIRHG